MNKDLKKLDNENLDEVSGGASYYKDNHSIIGLNKSGYLNLDQKEIFALSDRNYKFERDENDHILGVKRGDRILSVDEVFAVLEDINDNNNNNNNNNNAHQ